VNRLPYSLVLLVLCAALLHAGWNALLRSRADPGLATPLVAMATGLVSLPVAAVAPLPATASWPFLGTSVALHIAYFRLIAASYRNAPLSFAYPLTRGSAPLLVALGALCLLDEPLSPKGYGAVILLSVGIVSLARIGRMDSGALRTAVAASLSNGVVIAAYSLVDGCGVRASGTAAGYSAWLFALCAALLGAVELRRHGLPLLAAARSGWPAALLGGTGTLAAYGITLWVMTQAPIALVAALRETSIVFGALIGAALLGERPGPKTWTAVVLVAAGAFGVRLH
jgi:drug/metabolite transporter (DMT)-like permease